MPQRKHELKNESRIGDSVELKFVEPNSLCIINTVGLHAAVSKIQKVRHLNKARQCCARLHATVLTEGFIRMGMQPAQWKNDWKKSRIVSLRVSVICVRKMAFVICA